MPVRVSQDYFDIAQICRSGQCFRMEMLPQYDGAADGPDPGASSGAGRGQGAVHGVLHVGAASDTSGYGAADGPDPGASGGAGRRQGAVRASLVAHGRYLEITQRGNETTFSCGDEEFEGIWKRYFDLERDYGGIVRCAMDAGGHLRDAASCGGGLRILRQELWETLVTFIISQQNNITRIRRSVAALCERFGEGKTAWVWRGGGYAQGGHAPPQTGGGGVWPIGARCGDGQPGGANDESDGSGISGSAGYGGGDPAGCVSVGYHSFPTPEALAAATPEEMSACGLGYRGPYIIKTARQVLQGDVDLDGIAGMDYPQAREALKTLSGVGNKVADCVCLFALGHLDAFPVDTHIKQALGRHYPEGFPQGDFDGISGIMQQYLFYYELHGRAKSVPVQ